MHPHGMSAGCHGKLVVSMLTGPHLHKDNGFTILCRVCSGKMLIAEEKRRTTLLLQC